MTIRRKAMLLTIMTITAMIALNLVLGLYSMMSIIEHQEEDLGAMREKTFRVLISQSSQRLMTLISDWCAWDELHDYLAGSENGFADSYMTDEAIASIRFDGMLLLSSDGSVRAANLSGTGEDAALGDELAGLDVMKTLLRSREYESRVGMHFYKGRILIVAVSTVTNTDMTAAPNGVLIGFRDILSDIPPELSEGISAEVISGTGTGTDILLDDPARLTHMLSMSTPEFGSGGLLRLSIPRTHHLEARSAAIIGLIATAAASLFVMLLFITLVNRSILAPIE